MCMVDQWQHWYGTPGLKLCGTRYQAKFRQGIADFSLPQAAPRTQSHQVWDGHRARKQSYSRGPGTINSGKNLVIFRETELFQLGKYQRAVYLHFKGTAAALNEPGSQPVLILDSVLQTCSVWEVVSLSAIFN
jgi:hypothetical protein